MKKLMLTLCLAALSFGASAAKKMPVVFTFDDCLKHHLTVAAPELEKRGWRGSFNVITDAVGKNGSRLSWEDCRELLKRGHRVNSHTATHPHPKALFAKAGEEGLRPEVIGSAEKIKRETGVAPSYLCLPWSEGADVCARQAKAAGMEIFKVRRFVVGCNSPARTDKGAAAIVRQAREKGLKAVDFMIHGATPQGGGYMPFAKVEDYCAFLDEVKELEEKGEVVVVDYAVAQKVCR